MHGFAARSAPYQGTRNCTVSVPRSQGGYSLLKRLPRFGAEKHGFAVQNAPPHFLFETPKRKCAVHGGKEKVSGMSWPLTGQLTHTRERPVRTAAKIRKPSAGCAESSQMT